jgi:hypothetical protein
MSNLRFRYLYRDGGNYKRWGSVVFGNKEGVSAQAAEFSLRVELSGNGLFIAEQVGVPDVFLFSVFPLSPEDHCFQEFHSVEVVRGAITDRLGRTMAEFISEVARQARVGWHVFDPSDPFWPLER